MKGRVILFGLLIVAIALAGCAQMPAAPAAAPSGAISGQQVSVQETRLFDAGRQNLQFTIEAAGKVYQGSTQDGQGLIFFDGDKIYRGLNITGEVLFNLEGDNLLIGTNGPAAYHLEAGDKIGEAANGPIVYTISGTRLFEGSGTTGGITFESDVDLSVDLWPLLVVLADRRF
jgi:hypothetical protein